jgi:8-oxo-dGTP pyrophosphatase MutT (NUDIX family)
MNIKDKSYGVILISRKKNSEDRFLILHQMHGHWSFPKGHRENDETPIQTALRELEEETGIKEIDLGKLPNINGQYYFELDGKNYDKTVEYFIAFTKNDKVVIQESEIQNYKWATYQEALDLFTFEESKRILNIVNNYLTNMLK